MSSKSVFSNISNGFIKKDFKKNFMTKEGVEKLKNEFNLNFKDSKIAEKEIKTGLMPPNVPKCRYTDIFCLDSTRVSWKGAPFIHANWVDGYEKAKKFICCQGPMENTVPDFYKMIEVYKIPIIVMTTKTVENGHNKCFQYWPQDVNTKMTVSQYEITNYNKILKGEGILVSNLTILNKKNSEESVLIHVHFLNWPDHGVPENPNEFNMLHDVVTKYNEQINPKGNPVLIHCSAGIGRSGTFAVVDIARKMYAVTKSVNIFEIVKRLRTQRAQSVQTMEQYIFCYDAMNNFLDRDPK